jgi:hypothetical protein
MAELNESLIRRKAIEQGECVALLFAHMITLFCSFVNVVTILILISPSISEIWERYAALTFASDGLIGCSPEAGKFFARRRSAILALSNVQAFYALSPGVQGRLFSPLFFI